MPPLPGFSDNRFSSHSDTVGAAIALLKPLVPHFSEGRARIKLPLTSGAHFDDTAAQLEGYARPLWAVAALLAGQKTGRQSADESYDSLLEHWINGLENGVNPSHPDYWGAIGDWDQRMVEAEIISFALLSAPETFYTPLDQTAKSNLSTWLKAINGKIMPENNWRWFRVFSNLALLKVCGEDRGVHWPLIEQDLDTLETFYMSDGWSSDGVWRPTAADERDEGIGENAARGRHADYYSGSFALQFSQMLYSKFANDLNPSRCDMFRERARQFLGSFWAYFDTDGAAIPFGRSLCYRFAMGGFYAAFAYAGLCDDSNPLASHGAVKGMLLRHLRWWAANSNDSFWPDGTLSIGYLYPNMYMSENYNSPQSSYWALKSLVVVALAPDATFWTAEELPHPLHTATPEQPSDINGFRVIKPSRQILCNHAQGQHHFLLSSGQFCVWPMKATQAKYAKFAYSSAFGFSVPTGPLLAQIAPDSTLAVSRDNGATWAVRWTSVGETAFVPVEVAGVEAAVTGIVSRWRPWASSSIEIETAIIPPCKKWPDWHVRVHRIRQVDAPLLTAVEGGFAIFGQQKANGRVIPTEKLHTSSSLSFYTMKKDELAVETLTSALVVSSAGASGIVDFSPRAASATSRGDVMRPDPNTNIMTTKTLIPNLRHRRDGLGEGEYVVAAGIFAVAAKQSGIVEDDVRRRWLRRPSATFACNGDVILA